LSAKVIELVHLSGMMVDMLARII